MDPRERWAKAWNRRPSQMVFFDGGIDGLPNLGTLMKMEKALSAPVDHLGYGLFVFTENYSRVASFDGGGSMQRDDDDYSYTLLRPYDNDKASKSFIRKARKFVRDEFPDLFTSNGRARTSRSNPRQPDRLLVFASIDKRGKGMTVSTASVDLDRNTRVPSNRERREWHLTRGGVTSTVMADRTDVILDLDLMAPDWAKPDIRVYENVYEGPWSKKEDAEEFLRYEVGARGAKVIRWRNYYWIVAPLRDKPVATYHYEA